MAYIATRDIDLDHQPYAAGDTVTFTADQIALYEERDAGPIAELLACGAIEGGDAAEGDGADRPLLDHKASELAQIAARLAIAVPPKTTKPAIAALIEAKVAQYVEGLQIEVPDGASILDRIALVEAKQADLA